MQKSFILAILFGFVGLAQAQISTNTNQFIQTLISETGGVIVKCPSTLINPQRICFESDYNFSSFRRIWDATYDVYADRFKAQVATAWTKSESGDSVYSKLYRIDNRLLVVQFAAASSTNLVVLTQQDVQSDFYIRYISAQDFVKGFIPFTKLELRADGKYALSYKSTTFVLTLDSDIVDIFLGDTLIVSPKMDRKVVLSGANLLVPATVFNLFNCSARGAATDDVQMSCDGAVKQLPVFNP